MFIMKTTNLSILSFIQSTFNEYHVSGREPGSRAIMTKTEPNSQRNHVSGREEGAKEGGTCKRLHTLWHALCSGVLQNWVSPVWEAHRKLHLHIWRAQELTTSSLQGTQGERQPALLGRKRCHNPPREFEKRHSVPQTGHLDINDNNKDVEGGKDLKLQWVILQGVKISTKTTPNWK